MSARHSVCLLINARAEFKPNRILLARLAAVSTQFIHPVKQYCERRLIACTGTKALVMCVQV